jgi:hypothetical protein
MVHIDVHIIRQEGATVEARHDVADLGGKAEFHFSTTENEVSGCSTTNTLGIFLTIPPERLEAKEKNLMCSLPQRLK